MGKGLSFRLQFCLMSTVLTLFFLALVPVTQAKPPSGYGSRHGPYRYPIRNRYPLRYAKPKPKKYSYYPIEFSLFPPVNIFHAKHKVIAGLSLNIAYGLTTSVYGLEFGVIYNREIENWYFSSKVLPTTTSIPTTPDFSWISSPFSGMKHV